MNKIFNIGKIKLSMESNGFPKGFLMKRNLNTKECRHIMLQLLGIEIQTREDFEEQWEYDDYNKELCNDVNNWLKGECDDEKIIEYAYDCSDDQLGLFNMIPITQYLIKKNVI